MKIETIHLPVTLAFVHILTWDFLQIQIQNNLIANPETDLIER